MFQMNRITKFNEKSSSVYCALFRKRKKKCNWHFNLPSERKEKQEVLHECVLQLNVRQYMWVTDDLNGRQFTWIQKKWYEVCSNSIRIGIVVVVHWLGCVCNQSWHIPACVSNSWHKLQVAAFAQLAVVGRGSNTCIYVIVIFTIFTMCESTEQRICIKFCFKIWKTATETYQLLQQAYGEDAMGRTQVSDWFRRFKEGRTSSESDPRSGRPSTSRSEEMIAKVRTIVHNNRRLTVREIVGDFWKDTDLRQRRTSNEIRRRHYYTSRKRSSQKVSKSGRKVGRSVQLRKGTTFVDN